MLPPNTERTITDSHITGLYAMFYHYEQPHPPCISVLWNVI